MISICKLLLIKNLMNHATICVIKNQLRHPFSQYNKRMQDISTKFPVAFSYIKDSVVVSQNKNQSKTNKKTLQVYAIKCIDRKTEVRRVKTESVLVQWGCSHPQAYGFHHPWIALGASPPIPVKKLQNTISPISFLWGDISEINKQVSCCI